MMKTVLLLNPVYVTLFWAIVLSFRNDRQVPGQFLGKFMFVAFVLYLSHLLYFSGQYQVYYYLDSIYIFSSLLVYPLYHIYVRLLTVDDRFSVRLHCRYLIVPFIVFLLHLTGYFIMDKAEAIFYIAKVQPGSGEVAGITSYMQYVYSIFRIAFILQVLYYLYRNFRLILAHNHRLGDFYSNPESRKLGWVQFFNISLAVISFASAIAAAIGRDFFSASELHLAIPSVIFSSLLFLIGLLGNLQEKVVVDGFNLPDNDDYAGGEDRDKRSENIYSDNLRIKMDELFINKMVFRNPDLKIWDLSNMLGTNRTYTSKLINNYYGRNFCSHVNFYRVQYAKKILGKNKGLFNEDVAESSGFGSVSSLLRAFKTIEKKSLGDYRKELE